MGQKEVEGLSETKESIEPQMTLAQEIKGTIHLVRLTLAVAKIAIAILKLVKPYLSVKSRTPSDMRMPPADSAGDEVQAQANPPVELVS